MTGFDILAAGLRTWAEGDWVCSAAVELLIAGETWIRRDDFPAACIDQEEGFARIDWADAQAFAAGNPACTAAELGFLRAAVAIGADEFRLVSVDEDKRAAIVRAFATAARMEAMLRAGDHRA